MEGKRSRRYTGARARIIRSAAVAKSPIFVFYQSNVERVSSKVACFCYAEPCTILGLGMRPRNLVFITLLALCHHQLWGQTLTNALPPAQKAAPQAVVNDVGGPVSTQSLPDDPGQEAIPLAVPEPTLATGVPIEIDALHQNWSNTDKTWTLSGNVVIHYRNYILLADNAVYHQATSELEADGHLQVAGGPNDVLIKATHGDMRLNMHTARFYNVSGSQGVRKMGRRSVYSTTNPFLFTARVLLETGEGNYKIIDGTMTNCRLPKPDWRIISHTIALTDDKASTKNAFFELLNMPVFYLPYLSHPVNETGRQTGLLIPVISNSSIKGFIIGEQAYWAISRNMDIVLGTEYYSKRGWAPNGDFRYKGQGLDHLMVRWNALFDRGIRQQVGNTLAEAKPAGHLPGPVGLQLVDQGGFDIIAEGRKDLSQHMRAAGTVEYLSSYVYRLVFNDNYSQAVSSEVSSTVSLTHEHNGFVPSVSMDRFQTFASSTNGDEARILHLPNLQYDVVNRPLGSSPLYWGVTSSLSYLGRSEPRFHARNVGRFDFYPHLLLPFGVDGWRVVPEIALRDTSYSISQTPDLKGTRNGTPMISHDPLNRKDFEASVVIRPPALERDFILARWHRELRHVIEPELTYKFVDGIGSQARNVLMADTNDIATDTNEAGFSLTQRFYLRDTKQQQCTKDNAEATESCPAPMREWASWQIAQKYFIDPEFGGALIPNRRNVFDSSLDLTGIAFLTDSRNMAPIISRVRFEAIDNLRIEWDMDYDPRAGQLDADNLFAGYSWGRTTLGMGHSLLNAVDENSGSASTIKSQQLQPFLTIGSPNKTGLNLAANAGYDYVLRQLQYGGAQVTYNWDCCGLTFGYRRFQLGTVRDETQYLYSFTLANFGSVGDVRRTNTVFRDPALPPVY